MERLFFEQKNSKTIFQVEALASNGDSLNILASVASITRSDENDTSKTPRHGFTRSSSRRIC